jgi:hypothetical protein
MARPRGVAAGLAILFALLLLGCDENGDTSASPATPATGSLVLLSGAVSATTLTTWDVRGRPATLSLPAPTIAWVSASRRGRLLATLADGGLLLSSGVPPAAGEDVDWTTAPPETSDIPPEPLYFAAWAPNGLGAAAIAADGSGSRTLVVFDPVGGETLQFGLEAGPRALPPVWLDIDRVAVPSGDVVTIVDTSAGELVAGPGGVAQLAASADGSRVAVARADGSAIEVRLTPEWLAGEGSAELAIQFGDAGLGSLALDRRAERLAVTWERDGAPGQVAIYRRAGSSWTEAARFDLPDGEARGVVSWLP